MASLRLNLCLALFVIAAFTSNASAQQNARPLWGDLQPGEYGVGFQTIYLLDSSRTWDTAPDSIATFPPGRPIRISVWYPSSASIRSGQPMLQRDYFYYRTADTLFRRLNALIERADVVPTRDRILGSDSVFQRFLQLPTAAFTNATPAPGRFPLIAYSEGYNDRSQDNTVFAEYLASHGFVVVTVPQVGPRSTRLALRITPADLETQARDVEFAIGVISTAPYVENRKLGVLGYSMGGVVSMFIASRNNNVDAIAGLDPSFRSSQYSELLTRSPFFDPRRIRVPLLSLQSGNRASGVGDTTFFNALEFSTRYVALVGNATHGDFSDFGALVQLLPVHVEDRSIRESHEAHQASARALLAFFRGTLKGDSMKLKDLAQPRDPLLRMRYWAGASVPTEEDLLLLVRLQGYERARVVLQQALARYPNVAVVDFATLNRLGYGLLEAGEPIPAVGVFRLNTDAHPALADAWDSLAEGYLAAGDRPRAKETYSHLLEVLVRDSSLSPDARTQYMRNTEEKIRSLNVSKSLW